MRPDVTTVDWLNRGLERDPEAVAVNCGELTLSYAELSRRCESLMAALRNRLAFGDRVAVLADNCHRYLELYLAATGAGLVLVPLDPTRTYAELRAILDETETVAVFTDRDVGSWDGIELWAFGNDYEELLSSGADLTEVDGRRPADLSPDSIAALFFTGGTTGASKGVMLTHANLAANARNLIAALDIGPDTCWLVSAPMFHISGTIGTLATLGSGGRHILTTIAGPSETLEIAARHAATTTLVLPPTLAALADAQLRRPQPLESLRMIAHGGGPISDAEVVRAHAAFPDVELVHLYGATEVSPIATALRAEEQLISHPLGRSSGRAIGEVAVEVRASDGSLSPVGEVGEIVVGGSTVMAGYWHRPDATAAVLDDDGWYHTGDLGYFDAESFLYVVDRASDVITADDRMIFSTVVERALCAVAGVQEAAALPDVAGGIFAVIVAPDSEHTVDACHDVLQQFCAPYRLTIRSEKLPRSGAGKILKRAIVNRV